MEYRRHLPTANQTAVLLNVLGGKSNKPATPGFVPYTPEELLPPYAQPEDLVFASMAVNQRTAKEFLRMSRDGELPRWVQAIADYDMMRKAAGED